MSQPILSTDSDALVRQKSNYQDLIVNNYAERPATIAEYDLQAHIDDSRSFWLYRNGRPMKRTWRELSRSEKLQQIQAEQRAAEVVINSPCEMGHNMSWFTPAQQVESQEYTLVDLTIEELSNEEQQALQQNSNVSEPEWECGWCMTVHAPGATTGICASCEAKYFSR